MRVDKYLKVSRLIKRRAIAKAATEAARVTVNGRIAKPSSDVHIGDRLSVTFAGHTLEVRVLSLDPRGRKGEIYYEVLGDSAAASRDKDTTPD